MIAVTSGEPAGIGPDICCLAALKPFGARLAVLGNEAAFKARSDALELDLEIERIEGITHADRHHPGRLQLVQVELDAPVEPGHLNPANAAAVVHMLEVATGACIQGEADAIVTAPVQKSVINAAGIPFTGHTELLGALTKSKRTVMMLASDGLRVALATTHLPLAKVSAAITKTDLEATIRIVDADLKRLFGIAAPRILVLGLNPHAGEHGVLGTEEIDIIEPAIVAMRESGIDVTGPVAADSAFTSASLARADVVLAMYHDQGLPVLKAQDFGGIVNVTLGLPIVRTSVDHGTALSLAATGRADPASLGAAIELAIELATKRSR